MKGFCLHVIDVRFLLSDDVNNDYIINTQYPTL